MSTSPLHKLNVILTCRYDTRFLSVKRPSVCGRERVREREEKEPSPLCNFNKLYHTRHLFLACRISCCIHTYGPCYAASLLLPKISLYIRYIDIQLSVSQRFSLSLYLHLSSLHTHVPQTRPHPRSVHCPTLSIPVPCFIQQYNSCRDPSLVSPSLRLDGNSNSGNYKSVCRSLKIVSHALRI